MLSCDACNCSWPGVLQVRVSSDVAHVLSLPRAQLDSFLGAVGVGLASKTAILQALQQCKSLMVSLSGGGSVSASFVSRSSSMTLPAVLPGEDWLWLGQLQWVMGVCQSCGASVLI